MKSKAKDKVPAQKKKEPLPSAAPAPPTPAQQSSKAVPPTPPEPPAGLDLARHAAAQRTAHQAEVIREGVIPALMATALNLDKYFDTGAYKLYLAQVLTDLGNPTDPIERMLVEQLCMAHFRTAQLHASAGQTEGLEATKLLNTVAARLLGEFRRTALSLQVYRATAQPTKRQKAQLKVFKAAQ